MMFTETQKQSARRAVRNALKNGILVRPAICNRCGASPAPASDGRSTIHGHHHDYSKREKFEWICAQCHRDETPLGKDMHGPVLSGSINPISKRDESKVLIIKFSFANGSTFIRQLARNYGVHRRTIQRAIRGECWSKLTSSGIAARQRETQPAEKEG